MARILIIEACPALRDSLHRLIELTGHEVRVAGDAAAARVELAAHPVALVVASVDMPACDVLGLLARLRREDPKVTVIALSGRGGCGDDDPLAQARALGARAVFPKPLAPRHLLRAVRGCLALAAAEPRVDPAAVSPILAG